MKLMPPMLGLLAIAGVMSAYGQTTYTYDFGTSTGTHSSGVSTTFLPNPEVGGGTDYARVGTGGGSLSIQNPGQASLGAGSELALVAPTGGSINKFAIYDYGDALGQFSVKFDMMLSGGSSGTISFFAGNGASFSDANAFSGSQVFSGVRWVFGASASISTTVRTGGSWVTTGITGTPFEQNNVYTVQIVGNNTTASLNYTLSGMQSVAANTFDLWINGVLVGNNLGKAQLASATVIDSFMFYGESSTGNVATIRLDNFEYGSAIPEPSSAAMLLGGLTLITGVSRRRRDKFPTSVYVG